MTKLQTNFSFQSFQLDTDDSKRQFIYQLQTMFTNVSNSTNATIDDVSYWSRERATGFTWIDGSQIYTKTISGQISGVGINSVAHGVTIAQLVSVKGILVNADPLTLGFSLPFVDPVTPADNIGLTVTATNINVNAGSGTYTGYKFYVTIEYTR